MASMLTRVACCTRSGPAGAATMPHDVSLLSTVAVGLTFAFLGGWLAVRAGAPPLVGYLLAGVMVGPFTPGFVADATLAPQLAEIGIILLMFGVGLHFSLGDLWQVRGVAIPGALGQIVVATALGAGVAWWWGWTWGAGLIFGLALSVASTVVLLRALEARGTIDTDDGRIAVGWLVVEDLVMVLALVLAPGLAGVLGGDVPADVATEGLAMSVAVTLGKLAIFAVAMLVVGRRLFPWVLARVEATGSRELFTLAVITLSLGVAFGVAKLFSVSFALGAFFAGVVVHESDLSHRAADELRPLQEVFAALFFVSVGMLLDPSVLVTDTARVATVVGIIVVGKSLAALAIVRLLGRPTSTALVVSAALAQIGEFSFILAGLGQELGLVTPDCQNLIVAGALVSIALNPLLFLAVDRWLGRSR